MSFFDQDTTSENRFVKYNPQVLTHLFGSDDMEPFWIADMDFKIAPPITNELQRIVNRGVYSYEFDTQTIYKEIANWTAKRHQLTLNRKAFLQVNGVLTGISLLIRELTASGDGILIQTPVYHQFAQIIKNADRKIVHNPLTIVEGKYIMNFDNLRLKLKTENVKLILLCNPHNPVGRVWKTEELRQLVALANEFNVTIISDEIHSDIIYTGHQFTSIITIDPENHIALLGSPAKTFGMQSIANGYLYIPKESVRKQVNHFIEGMYLNHGNAFTTFATIAAYRSGDAWLEELLAYLEETIHWIQNFFKEELPQVKTFPVEGTYQVWLDFNSLNLSDEALEELIIKTAKIGLTPGKWFCDNHGQFMRMNIATPRKNIQQALQQLSAIIHKNI